MGKKVFISAAGPLPSEKEILWQTAYGLRTWQFLHAFKKGWEIRLVLLTEDAHYKNPPEHKVWQKMDFEGQDIWVLHLDKDQRGFKKNFRRAFQESEADLCIGINNLPSYFLAKLKPKIPFWADLNGWLMAEAQSAAFVFQDSSYLATLWMREKTILERIDQASVASTPQLEATYGEMASLLRLNHYTESWDFFHVIPPTNEITLDEASNYKLQLPKGAQSVLFCGSYNTWLDEETLFEGLEKALNHSRHLHFVSTGDPAEAKNNPVLDRFIKRIEKSPNKERYHFLGRIKKEDLLSVYNQVSAAINLDRNNLETHFGARNRINEWLHYEVPIITTVGSEITKVLSEANVVFPVRFQDPNDVAKKIQEAIETDKDTWTKKAKAFLKSELNYEKTLRPLTEWLETPRTAPDKGQSFSGGLISKLKFRLKKDGIFFLLGWLIKRTK